MGWGRDEKNQHCCSSSCVQGTVLGGSAVYFLKNFCLSVLEA